MANPSDADPVLENGHTEPDPMLNGDAEPKALDDLTSSNKTNASFLDYQTYTTGDQIVSRKKDYAYQQSDQNLVIRKDIKLQSFEWNPRFVWTNETSSDNTYTESVQEGLKVREGQETQANFGISFAFEGLGINAGGSVKNFSETETSSLTTQTRTIPVPAHTTIYFYQKQYNFLVEVWFWQYVSDWSSEANPFRIGANKTYEIVKRTATTTIYTQEFATLERQLLGSTSVNAKEAPRLDDPGTVRQFTNITQTAKNKLKTWGITG